MQSYMNLFVFVIVAGLMSVGFSKDVAAERSEESASAISGPNETDIPPFPYIAEMNGDNIYIRSGPGTNFYHCGKLNKGDKVTVVGKQFSWARIVPPPGSFSWIAMQYVRINPNDPAVGIVTGDNVRVYAGSDYVKPLYSTTLQGKLNKGEEVKLLGEQMEDYYKISPPPFAYLWVSTNFTSPLKQLVVVPPAESNDTDVVVPPKATPEAELEAYYTLQKQLKAERAKPMDQQDYTNIKNALVEIANNKEAEKAARYAKFLVGQIEGFELALAVTKEVRLQNEQLEKINAGIEKARTTKLAEVENLGKFSAIGEFQTYETYGPEHYRIVDESGNMICYSLPSGAASQMDLSRLIGRKVGIVGTIEPHLPTKKALVRFSEIVELK